MKTYYSKSAFCFPLKSNYSPQMNTDRHRFIYLFICVHLWLDITHAAPYDGTDEIDRTLKYYCPHSTRCNLNKFNDYVYNRFLLRDLLRKALPGLLLLIGMFSVLWPRTIWRVLFKRRTDLIPYVLVYGASLALGGLARTVNPWRSLWKW